MADKNIPTAAQVQLIDCAVTLPPPGASKLILLSKYGIARIGTYVHGFDVAWAPLPKVPPSVKEKLLNVYL